jgi:hypothetical protein
LKTKKWAESPLLVETSATKNVRVYLAERGFSGKENSPRDRPPEEALARQTKPHIFNGLYSRAAVHRLDRCGGSMSHGAGMIVIASRDERPFAPRRRFAGFAACEPRSFGKVDAASKSLSRKIEASLFLGDSVGRLAWREAEWLLPE